MPRKPSRKELLRKEIKRRVAFAAWLELIASSRLNASENLHLDSDTDEERQMIAEELAGFDYHLWSLAGGQDGLVARWEHRNRAFLDKAQARHSQ